MISYCLNIHPGESLAAVCHAITHHATAVKAQLAPDAPYPLGLRLAASAAAELDQNSHALEEFASLMSDNDFYVTEVNGFPYGTFHGSRVKSSVYQPDWTTSERSNYTMQIARVLSQLMKPGERGSISTVPLGYKQLTPSGAPGNHTAPPLAASRQAVESARRLARLALKLSELEQQSGRTIAVAIEPEPDCLLEYSHEVIEWFDTIMLRHGASELTTAGMAPSKAEALLRRHLTLCFDTCHFAVNFEEPLIALRKLEAAGITISRIQLSAALQTVISPESLQHLQPFIDPVYLHQTRIRLPDKTLITMPDLLEEQLAAAAQYQGCELRTHFHTPLYFTGNDTLQSTAQELTPEFMRHVKHKGYPLEVETYTFDVLPPELRSSSVVDNIIRECRSLT